MTAGPESEAELEAFLAAFENGTWPKKQWTHAAHIVMACAYLTTLPREEATERIRAGIPLYNVAQGGQNTGTSGYHETLTIFWSAILANWLAALPGSMPRVEKVRAAVDRFGGERLLHRLYWSFDVAASVEARRRWIPPDLQPLP